MIKTIKIAWKDLKLLSRDWYGLFWLFVFPMIFAVVFGTIFASGQQGTFSFHLAVVGDSDSPQNQWMIDRLRQEDGLTVTLHSRSEAREQVRKDQAAAYVRFPNFSGNDGSITSLISESIEIGVDRSRAAELSFLKGLITQILMDRMNANTSSKNTQGNGGTSNTASQRSFFQVTAVNGTGTASPSSPFAVSFPQAILWGLLACAAGFATSMVAERTGGTLLRLRMAPVHPVQLLLGKALACFLTCAAVILVLSSVGVLFFNVEISRMSVFLLALFSSSFCVVGLMMLISTLGQTERAVGGSGWAIMAIMAMFGGGMVPLFTMPGWMKTVSDYSPVKWSIYLIEGALWRNLPLEQIMWPTALLMSFGLVFFVAGLFNFYRVMQR